MGAQTEIENLRRTPSRFDDGFRHFFTVGWPFAVESANPDVIR